MDPRWSVALVGRDVASRARLRAGLEAVGGRVVVEAGNCADVLAPARAGGVDVGVAEVVGDGAELPALERPVVVVTADPRRLAGAPRQTRDVMAVLLKPVRAAQLPPTLDVAIARFAERRDLERRLDERKTIKRQGPRDGTLRRQREGGLSPPAPRGHGTRAAASRTWPGTS